MRAWMARVGMMLLGGSLLVSPLGCGPDPNHDIDPGKARAAANRVHSPPKLSPSDRARAEQDHGG